MNTELKSKCIKEFSLRISLPETGSIIFTKDGLLITYFIDNKMRFITLEGEEKRAQYLWLNGFIHDYDILFGESKLWQLRIDVWLRKDATPMQVESVFEVEIEDVKITAADIIKLAAINEYDLTCTLMGIEKTGVVKRMVNYLTNKAA